MSLYYILSYIIPHTKILLQEAARKSSNLDGVKRGSAIIVKQRTGYVHQNVTEEVHVTISDNNI